MSLKWQNRILYWALAIIPLSGLYAISMVFGPIAMVFYLLFYCFLYRPLIDTQRLLSLGKIEEKDAWKFFVPLRVDTTRYMKSLWLD